jgi:chaperone required for assembly of F1-ATPase
MSQAKYTWDILKKFRMLSCKPIRTPLEVGLKLYIPDDSNLVDVTLYRQLVEILIYLTTTQIDIFFEVSMISRFITEPKELHWKLVKRILRYLRSTIGYGLVYRSIEDFRLIGYTDSDWASYMDDMKSTLGYSFSMGSTTIAWSI